MRHLRLNHGLTDGEVQPQGIDLTVVAASSPERHWRMGRHLEFDVCEFSMSKDLKFRDRPPSPFVGVPAFPHRRFRHSFVFVNTWAGIHGPKDLEGRAVGLRTWQTTAGLWVRGILQDDYGVDLRTIRWLTQGTASSMHSVPRRTSPSTGCRIRARSAWPGSAS